VVPPAVARHGAYIAKNVVLMPSFVNVGAYVDEGTMIDTWATVGSCAQIGKNVHLSAAWASAECSNRCKQAPPSSKTIVSWVHDRKSSKASSSRRTRS